MTESESDSESRVKAVLNDDLLAIGEQLRTQDNRCTANPMFIVQQKRSFGCEPGEGNMDVWLDEDWEEVDEETAAKLDELDEAFEWELEEDQAAMLKQTVDTYKAAHGWQTLETSPRDGVVFLAFVPHDQGGFAFAAVWNTADRLLCMMSGDDFWTDKATHWMLLPEFPENASVEQPALNKTP